MSRTCDEKNLLSDYQPPPSSAVMHVLLHGNFLLQLQALAILAVWLSFKSGGTKAL